MKVNRKLLLANFLIVFIALLAIEIVSRNILNNKYNRSFDSSIIQPNKYFDSDGLKPNANAIVWGKNFTTDAFGFRSTGKPFDKKKKTWLFIGDSVTQGVGVDDSSNYVSLMAKSLDSMNVLNCSMIGWSVYDYKNVIETLLADTSNPLNISLITIGWCLNDVYGKSKTSELPAVGNKGWKSTVSSFLHEHYATYRLVKLYVTQNSNHYYKYDMQFYVKENEKLLDAVETLDSIFDVCKQHSIEVKLLFFPYHSALLKMEKENIRHYMMSLIEPADFYYLIDNKKDFLVHCKDMWYPIRLKRNNLSIQSGKDIDPKDLYLFSDEIHFSSLGHHIIASIILNRF